jgi:hypothetical protein
MVMSVWQLNVLRRKCLVDDLISLKDVGAIVIKSLDCLYCFTSVVYVCMYVCNIHSVCVCVCVCVFTLVNSSTAVSKAAHVYTIKANRRMEYRSTHT